MVPTAQVAPAHTEEALVAPPGPALQGGLLLLLPSQGRAKVTVNLPDSPPQYHPSPATAPGTHLLFPGRNNILQILPL